MKFSTRTIIRRTWRKLAARPSLKMLNELLFDCSLNGLGILNYENEVVSGERNFVENILPLYMDDATPLMIDVGANIGNYTKLVKKSHPGASLLAFEPNPKTFIRLEEELAGSGVRLVNKGLGSANSVMKFYDRGDCGGSSMHGSLYKEVIEEIHNKQAVATEVDVTSLDLFSREHEIGKIKLLKIDTEGHELEVLKGARENISNENIDIIHLEFNEMNIISRVFFRDLTRVLPNHIPYRLLPKGAILLGNAPVRTELFAFQNLIFIHKRYKPDKYMRPTACTINLT